MQKNSKPKQQEEPISSITVRKTKSFTMLLLNTGATMFKSDRRLSKNIRRKVFMIRAVKRWNRLLWDVVMALFLETTKIIMWLWAIVGGVPDH